MHVKSPNASPCKGSSSPESSASSPVLVRVHEPGSSGRPLGSAFPTPAASSAGSNKENAVPDSLEQLMGRLSVHTDNDERVPRTLMLPEVRFFTPADMLRQREIAEGTPLPFSDKLLKHRGGYFVATRARAIGLWLDWHTCSDQTSGHPHNSHTKYKSIVDAAAAWTYACIKGYTCGPLHPDSEWPLVVSDKELKIRADAANLRTLEAATVAYAAIERANEANAALATAVSGATGDLMTVHPDHLQPVAPSSTPLTAAAVASMSRTPAVAAALYSQASGSSHSACTAPSVASAAVATPPDNARAWVVIKGRRPGVYSNKQAWRQAKAVSDAGWAFAAVDMLDAQRIFDEFSAYTDVVQ